MFVRRMGIYLSSPKTDKTSEDDENAELRFGLSAMQGWRESMEDAVRTFLMLKVNALQEKWPWEWLVFYCFISSQLVSCMLCKFVTCKVLLHSMWQTYWDCTIVSLSDRRQNEYRFSPPLISVLGSEKCRISMAYWGWAGLGDVGWRSKKFYSGLMWICMHICLSFFSFHLKDIVILYVTNLSRKSF